MSNSSLLLGFWVLLFPSLGGRSLVGVSTTGEGAGEGVVLPVARGVDKAFCFFFFYKENKHYIIINAHQTTSKRQRLAYKQHVNT